MVTVSIDIGEEHANKCPHYINNVHDRGDDSLCDKWVCEVKSLPKWIPVTERLPEYNLVVLVTDGKNVGTGCRYALGGTGFTGWAVPFADIEEDDVSHWMPLPSPPEDGE